MKVLERLGCGHLAQALVIGFFGRSGSRSHLGLLQCGLDFEYSVSCGPMPASLGVVLMIMITLIISTMLIKKLNHTNYNGSLVKHLQRY